MKLGYRLYRFVRSKQETVQIDLFQWKTYAKPPLQIRHTNSLPLLCTYLMCCVLFSLLTTYKLYDFTIVLNQKKKTHSHTPQCNPTLGRYAGVKDVSCDKCARKGLGVPAGAPFYHCDLCKVLKYRLGCIALHCLELYYIVLYFTAMYLVSDFM